MTRTHHETQPGHRAAGRAGFDTFIQRHRGLGTALTMLLAVTAGAILAVVAGVLLTSVLGKLLALVAG